MKSVYIGTYTSNIMNGMSTNSKGIYTCVLDETSGKIKITGATSVSENPSYMAISTDHQFLVVGNEKRQNGALDSYTIGPDSSLEFISRKLISGSACCHVGISVNQRFVTVANYGNGSIATIEIDENGILKEILSDIQFQGSGVDKVRQECPHAHSVTLIDKYKMAIACDLGTDRLMLYKYNEIGVLSKNSLPFVDTPPGSGPRHIAVSQNQRFIYVTAELNNTVIAYEFVDERPVLKQTISTLPAQYAGYNLAADIHIDQSGHSLYVSNRGHDSIVHYTVDKYGYLNMECVISSGGHTPRNFAISDNFLICANQDSDHVAVFKIEKNGALGKKVDELEIPSPTMIMMN